MPGDRKQSLRCERRRRSTARAGARAVLGLILLGACPQQVPAQCQRAKLIASDGTEWDQLGFSVAVLGNTAVAGARLDSDLCDACGSASVFDRVGSTWTQSKLVPFDPDFQARFGWSVALSQDYLLVGAPYEDPFGPNSGSVYVFRAEGSSWMPLGKWLPHDGEEMEFFGYSVAMRGDRAIVGADYDDDKGYTAGSAYIYEQDAQGQWFEAAKLLASDGDSYDRFGAAVAIDGDIAVVGAVDDEALGKWSGSAYVFERQADGKWIQAAKLLPNEPYAALWKIGQAVAVSEGMIWIGAPVADFMGIPGVGSVYVFEKDFAGQWMQAARLVPADPANSQFFGWALALDGNTGVIGARGDKPYGGGSGSAYVFVRDPAAVWKQAGKLVAADGAAYDWFASSVALSGTTALIGAYADDDKGSESGSAYIFAVGPDEDGDGVMDACEAPGDLNCDGAIDAFDIDPFVLALTDPAGYAAKFPNCTLVNADCNGDGTVDAFDIDPFVKLLTGFEPAP